MDGGDKEYSSLDKFVLCVFFFTVLNGVACAILCTFIIVNLYNPTDDDWVQIREIPGSDNIKTLTLAIVILGYIIFAVNKIATCFKKAPPTVFTCVVIPIMVVIVLGCLASSILGVFVSIKYFQLVSTNQVPEDNLSSIINIRDGVTALTCFFILGIVVPIFCSICFCIYCIRSADRDGYNSV